ncbi:MAG: hypothetical protein PHW13_10140 [Methylococcales bacterium]|nr:hypothetical protein [Methylococcales bacterium]
MLKARPYKRDALALGTALILLTSATAAFSDTAVNLGGYLNAGSPGSFDLASLQSFAASNPAAVTTVTVGSDVYTGVSLFSYLDSYVATDPTVPKNDILRDYAVATGSDGSSTVYALGSLNGSGFGTLNDIIAYSDSNGTLTGASLIAADGSSITNLSSLDVGHVGYAGAGAGGVSTTLTVNGDLSASTTYTASDLPGTLTTQVLTVSTPPVTGQSFTGVSLWDMLVQDGLSTDPATLANEYVIATGSDNYQSIFSLEELNPLYGNQNDLVAYATGAGASLGSSGFARIVAPGDAKAGRYVSNLESLTVVAVTSVPLPASAVLMFGGLFAIGLGNFRKRLSPILAA